MARYRFELLKIALLVAVAIVGGVVSARFLIRHPAPCPYCSGIMHKPASGCPSGYEEKPKMFERNGARYPGCINFRKPLSIDEMLPGETIELYLH